MRYLILYRRSRSACAFALMHLAIWGCGGSLHKPPAKAISPEERSVLALCKTGEIFRADIPDNLKAALRSFADGAIPQGGTLPYGGSVKYLRVAGKSTVELKRLLLASGFRELRLNLLRYPDNTPILDKQGHPVPLLIYSHPDGGMVLIKPQGNPTSRYRPMPTVSKAVRLPYDAPENDFGLEGFKVDEEGCALPKSPQFLIEPYPSDSPAAENFTKAWGDRSHLPLP